jgi:hypothetical protein
MAEEGFTGTNGSHGSFAEGIEVRSVVERYCIQGNQLLRIALRTLVSF